MPEDPDREPHSPLDLRSGGSDLDVIEPAHRIHLGPGKPRGRLRASKRPGHDFDVVLLEQRLEPGDLGLAPGGVMPIEEATDEEVRLARAAMPGAEFQPPNTGSRVHRFATMAPPDI